MPAGGRIRGPEVCVLVPCRCADSDSKFPNPILQLHLGSPEWLQVTRGRGERVLRYRLQLGTGGEGDVCADPETRKNCFGFPELSRLLGGLFLVFTSDLCCELPSSLGEHHVLCSGVGEMIRNGLSVCAVPPSSCHSSRRYQPREAGAKAGIKGHTLQHNSWKIQ